MSEERSKELEERADAQASEAEGAERETHVVAGGEDVGEDAADRELEGDALGVEALRAAEGERAAAAGEQVSADRVHEAVKGLFERLGAELEVEVVEGEERFDCTLRFGARDAILHVMPEEELLEAAQYLLQRMVYRDADAGKRVALSVGSPLATDDPAMAEMARRLAGSVRRMNRAITIVPIHARDRKAIHQTLAEEEGVQTRSEGEGLLRRLVVEPR